MNYFSLFGILLLFFAALVLPPWLTILFALSLMFSNRSLWLMPLGFLLDLLYSSTPYVFLGSEALSFVGAHFYLILLFIFFLIGSLSARFLTFSGS